MFHNLYSSGWCAFDCSNGDLEEHPICFYGQTASPHPTSQSAWRQCKHLDLYKFLYGFPNNFGWKPYWFLTWDTWSDIVGRPLWQIFFASLSCILWESWEHLGRRSSLFDSGTQRIPTYTRVKERCCSQSKEFQRTTSTLNAQKSDFCNGLGLELLILFLKFLSNSHHLEKSKERIV